MTKYYGVDHMELALLGLKEVHPNFTTILAILHKRAGGDGQLQFPQQHGIGRPVASREENELLKEYFLVPNGTDTHRYYMPFTKKVPSATPKWKDESKYAGGSFQRQRNDKSNGKDAIFKIVNPDSRAPKFNLTSDIAEKWTNPKISDAVIGSLPLNLHALSVWLLRDTSFESHEASVLMLQEVFDFQAAGLTGSLIEDLDLGIASIPLHESAMTIDDLLGVLDAYRTSERDNGRPAKAIISPDAKKGGVRPDATHTTGWEKAPHLEDSLSGLMGMEEPALQAITAMQQGHNVIFTGPPGVGKTKLAAALFKYAGYPYRIHTANESWTHFQVIGGLFPKGGADSELAFRPGLILQAMIDAEAIIIDEFNRADIDKAMGELFTLFAGDAVSIPYKDENGYITIAYEGKDDKATIVVPTWWRMIGCMNDIDKSTLSRLSFALSRRFAFVPVAIPDPSVFTTVMQDRIAGYEGIDDGRKETLTEMMIDVFASTSNGLRSIGMGMGIGIAQNVVDQVATESRADWNRSLSKCFASALELHVVTQFQGRADKHRAFVDCLKPYLDAEDLDRLNTTLSTWTDHEA